MPITKDLCTFGLGAVQLNIAVDISHYKTVLLVLKDDQTAELWLDTAAVAMKCIVTRDVAAGTVVFQQDIGDITALRFPCVSFGASDQVLCLIREALGFALAFDMNPSQQLDMAGFERELGRLYRRLRYRHLYEIVGDNQSLDRLITKGWFPFVEILHDEFGKILGHHEANLALTAVT